MMMTFRKQRRAKSKDDFETWVETDIANTLNVFDVGDKRATTVIIDEEETSSNRL